MQVQPFRAAPAKATDRVASRNACKLKNVMPCASTFKSKMGQVRELEKRVKPSSKSSRSLHIYEAHRHEAESDRFGTPNEGCASATFELRSPSPLTNTTCTHSPLGSLLALSHLLAFLTFISWSSATLTIARQYSLLAVLIFHLPDLCSAHLVPPGNHLSDSHTPAFILAIHQNGVLLRYHRQGLYHHRFGLQRCPFDRQDEVGCRQAKGAQ